MQRQLLSVPLACNIRSSWNAAAKSTYSNMPFSVCLRGHDECEQTEVTALPQVFRCSKYLGRKCCSKSAQLHVVQVTNFSEARCQVQAVEPTYWGSAILDTSSGQCHPLSAGPVCRLSCQKWEADGIWQTMRGQACTLTHIGAEQPYDVQVNLNRRHKVENKVRELEAAASLQAQQQAALQKQYTALQVPRS